MDQYSISRGAIGKIDFYRLCEKGECKVEISECGVLSVSLSSRPTCSLAEFASLCSDYLLNNFEYVIHELSMTDFVSERFIDGVDIRFTVLERFRNSVSLYARECRVKDTSISNQIQGRTQVYQERQEEDPTQDIIAYYYNIN